MTSPEDSRYHEEAETLEQTPPADATADVPDVPLPSSIPQRIGRYRIKRAIATGGMGTVYEALQENPRRPAAVKVMKHGIASRSALRRFEYESQILARLRHPGIAQVYEAGMHDDGQGGVPYFAMEYVAGARDIVEYAESKSLGLRERLELFIKVCEAVHHGHQKGIIHRDLKPANILVDSTGQPKIIDFGVARATDSDLAVTTLQTNVGQLVGTVQYMSPEQIDADPHDIDTRSDVYALGVLLYELLTGKLPYNVVGTVIYEATRIIREQSPRRLSTIDKTLRGDVETIVQHALEKDRDRRYQSAHELAQDIRRYLDNRTILARPPSMVYQMRTFVRRNRLLVGSVAAVFASLVLSVILVSIQARKTAEQRDIAAEQRDIAAEQRDIAQRRFDQVRQLANTFMFDVHDKIQELDGAIPARELLVTTALEYLDDLATQVGDDADLTVEVANAYDRVGDIRGGTRNPSLGDTAGALENYRTALALRTDLLDAAPDDLKLLAEIGKSQQRIGDMLDDTGDVTGALEAYAQWLEISKRIAEIDESWASQRKVALAHNAVGGTYAGLGQFDEARRHYEKSLAMRRRLQNAKAEPDLELMPQRDLSVGLFSLAGLLYDSGDYAGALVYYREGLSIREALLRRAPDSGRYKRDLSIAHFFAGRAYLGLNDATRALGHLEQFLDAAQERADANPSDARAKRDLAAAHEALGRAYALMGDMDRARSSYETFQAIIVPLSESDPDHVGYRELVAQSHVRLGEAALADGEAVESVVRQRQALMILDELAAADPGNIALRLGRGQVLAKLGEALSAAGETGEARRRLEAAEELYEGLAGAQPGNGAITADLDGVRAQLAGLDSPSG